MSSSTRQHIMGEAGEDWLRESVQKLRNSKDEDKPSKAKQALKSAGFTDNNPCHVYWQRQFRVSQLGNSGPPDLHLKKLELWIETVHALHELNGDEESSWVNEWLVLAYYRLFRCYNECHERFTLQGLEGTAHTADRRSAVLEEMKEEMDAEVPKFEPWRKVLMRKEQRPSHQYHKSRYEDATWDYGEDDGEDFDGLYNKEPKEYTDLMNNEHQLYLSRYGDEPFDVSSLEGNTLITFFTNDLNFWATALLDRLEALAPVSIQGDSLEERVKKEKDYLASWERAREGSADAKEDNGFSEYRTHVEKFSMLMELLFDLKDEQALKAKKKRSDRLREYAELAHLHCIIAALPAQRKKWDKLLKDDHAPHPPWTLLRTNDDARAFLELSAEERYEELILQHENLGYALASVVRWLAHRSNGFYIALASNVQEGVLITNKTRRKATSSSWGEKVVIKHGSTYHQFISSPANGLGADGLKDGLDGANRYFNEGDQDIKGIEINPVCFDVLHITSPRINGELLSKEWERARNNDEIGALVKHFAAIVDFFLHPRGGGKLPKPPLPFSQAICLPRLEEHESFNRGMGRLKFTKESRLPFHLSEWIHGDEWGENFTVLYDATSTRMYALDLEDAVKRNHPKEGMEGLFEVSSNGGYHGQRLYQKAIHQDFSSGVPGGAFNALSAVGRLLAALIQKSEFNTRSDSSANVRLLFTLMKNHHDEKHGIVRLGKDDYNVMWLSLFDWLLHWTTKVDTETGLQKFSEDSYNAHVNAFVHHQD